MTTIAFVRHGNTDWNIEKRAQGHSNNPLNEIGLRQAEAVARRLAKEDWDMIISSDLLRTRKTAEIISSYCGKPIQFDQRLREIDRGQTQGTIEKERIQRWGEEWRRLELGVESGQSVQDRGLRFVEDVIEQYPDKKILVVSHGLIIKQTLRGLLTEAALEGPLENTSVTIVSNEVGSWECSLYNCSKHLQEPFTIAKE